MKKFCKDCSNCVIIDDDVYGCRIYISKHIINDPIYDEYELVYEETYDKKEMRERNKNFDCPDYEEKETV